MNAKTFCARLALLVFVCAATPAHALYDPQPDDALARAQGEWVGTLTYRDYQRPDRMVTLPTRLFAALAAPDTLTLHYVFDDGPGKTVFSYESLQVDVANRALTWTTGDAERKGTAYRIVSLDRQPALTRLVFEGAGKDARPVRVTIEVGPTTLMLRKEEIDAVGAATLRNTFAFRRGPA